MFKKLIKNVYRYLIKAKASFIGLCVLIIISIFSFSLLSNLSSGLKKSYNNLVSEQRLHDIVVNESYNESKKNEKQKEFENFLLELKNYYQSKNINFEWKRSNSLIVNSLTNDITYKIIEHSIDDSINKFDEENNIKLNSINFSDIDLFKIYNNAQSDIADFIINKDQNNLNYEIIDSNLIKTNNNHVFDLKKIEEFDVSKPVNARLYLLKNIVFGFWESRQDPLFVLFEKAYKYSLENINYDPLKANVDLNNNTSFTQDEAIKVAQQFMLILYPSKKGIKINGEVTTVVKEHRIAFSFASTGIPIPVYFDVRNAYGIIGLEEFVKAQQKEALNIEIWKEGLKNNPNLNDFEKWFAKIDEKHIIKIDSTAFVLLSTAITPDFMYPIISFSSIIPNPNSEGLVYLNKNGYGRILDAFRSNPKESSLQISLRYSKNNAKVEDLIINEVLSMINKTIKEKQIMNWPESILAAYKKDDTNNKITPSPLRLVFVEKIVKTISAFGWIIISIIILLSIFVIAIIVKRFIQQNKINIGISIANGISKWKVILSFTFIGILPCVVGGIIGYIIAHFAQPLGLKVIKDYWLIPTKFEAFDFGELLIVILIPFAIFFITILILATFELKKDTVNLMRGGSTFKVSKIVSFIKAPFKYTPGFSKYLITLSFGSVARIILFGLMIAISFGGILFLTGTHNKISQTSEKTLESKRYKFAIELTTPTIQGGQYHSVSSNAVGSTLVFNDFSLTQKYESSDYSHLLNNTLFNNLQNLKLVGEKDDQRKRYDINYIKNAYQVKQFLDFDFGLGQKNQGNSSNPWSITKSLIPENTLQGINEYYRLWATKIVNDHTILDSNSSKSIGSIGYKLFNIQKMKDDFEFYNQNDFLTILFKFFNQIQFNIFDQSKEYELDVISYDSNFEFNQNKIKVFFDKNQNDWQILVNEDLSENKQQFVSKIKYWDGEKNVNLLVNDDILYDDLYFLNLNNETKKISHVSLGSYFKFKFLNKNPDGDFVYNMFLNEKNLKRYLVNNHYDGKKIEFENNILYLDDIKFLDVKINQQKFIIANKKSGEKISTNSKVIKVNYSINSAKATGTYNSSSPSIKLSDEYINSVLMTHPSNNKDYQDVWSGIVFNTVGLDYKVVSKEKNNTQQDEPYIWIDATIKAINNKEHNTVKNPKINGIIKDSQLIKLIKNKKIVNNLLFDNNDNLVIINKSAAKFYNLKIGDEISFSPNNRVDRYISKNNYITKLKVAEIIDTVQGNEFYISIDLARKILGMESSVFSDSLNFNDYQNSFNGILTNKTAPQILVSNIPIYSPSGLYPVGDKWNKDANTIDLIKNILNFQDDDTIDNKNPKYNLKKSQESLVKALNYKDFNELYQASKNIFDEHNYFIKTRNENEQAEWIIDELIRIYGNDTYVSLLQNVELVDILFNVLATASKTIQIVETSVILILLSIIIIVITLFSLNSISDILKVAKLLKNMGYSDTKNGLLFLMAFVPAIVFGSILAIPIVAIALNQFTEVIFSSIGVLLSTSFVWWHFFVGLLVLIIIFMLLWLFAILILKKANVADASKRS